MINFRETFNINGANSDKSGLTFFSDTFWINKPSTPTPGWKDVTVTGEDTLNLPNAKADGLNYLKAYGKCYQSNLPYGFTQLESISGISNKTWFDTGVAGNNNNLRFVFTGYKDSAKAYSAFFGNYVDESSNVTRLITGSGSNGIIAEVNRKSASSTITNTVNYLVAHTYELYKENGVSILKVDGTQVDTMADSSGTANSTNIGMNTSKTNPSVPTSDIITTFQGTFEIYDGSTLIRNYVMAKRDSDNAVGMYDIVNNTFKISEGTEPFTAGAVLKPLPTYPLAITCNNGVLKFGKPLILNSTRYYAYIYTIGTWKYSNDSYSIVIPVTVGHKYKITVPTTNPLNNAQNTIFRYGFVDTINEDWKNDDLTGQTDIRMYDYVRTSPQDTPSAEITATHPYLVIQMSAFVFDYILSNNLITVTDQIIYTDGTTETIKDSLNNTATCENLLSAGTYKDVQSILDGTVTRNVVVKVLTGDETWTANTGTVSSNTYLYWSLTKSDIGTDSNVLPSNSTRLLCTHYPNVANVGGGRTNEIVIGASYINFITRAEYSSVDDWKAFLQSQYAANTPVILVYPLATAVTEEVTAQILTTKRGNNTIEITQASLGDLTLEAQYQAGVTVTIEEVEEANLDNNVTVVIGE